MEQRVLENSMATLDGCRLYEGYVRPDGYGRLSSGEYAHRVSYRQEVGPVPEGLELDHLCEQKSCVNPDHLEPVTHQENMRRSIVANKETCRKGLHSWVDENIRIQANGHGICRPCQQESNRLSYLERQVSR